MILLLERGEGGREGGGRGLWFCYIPPFLCISKACDVTIAMFCAKIGAHELFGDMDFKTDSYDDCESQPFSDLGEWRNS